MTTRRAILKSGIALPATSLAGSLLPQAGAYAAGTLRLERFIYDVRFAESYELAQKADASGVPLSPIADDLMTLWYDELDLLWKESPQPLGGTTMVEAAFVLETLAMDRGMRLVFRGEHGLVENGQIAHRFAGPAESIAEFTSEQMQADWQATVAENMCALPLGRPEADAVEVRTPISGLSIRDVPLVSWVIAPREAVAVTLPG